MSKPKAKSYYFCYTNKVVTPQELLNRSHQVRTIGGDSYINHLNGLFVSDKRLDSLTLSQIYPLVVKAYSTDRKCFAKRRRTNQPLLRGYIKRK